MRDALSSAATVLALVAAMLATKTIAPSSGKQDTRPVLAASSSVPDRSPSAQAATPN